MTKTTASDVPVTSPYTSDVGGRNVILANVTYWVYLPNALTLQLAIPRVGSTKWPPLFYVGLLEQYYRLVYMTNE